GKNLTHAPAEPGDHGKDDCFHRQKKSVIQGVEPPKTAAAVRMARSSPEAKPQRAKACGLRWPVNMAARPRIVARTSPLPPREISAAPSRMRNVNLPWFAGIKSSSMSN